MSRSRGLLLDASHTGFDQRIVMRVLMPSMVDDKSVEQFNREASILSRLESEHVARIVDFGRMPDGAVFLAREHVRGESLASHAAAQGGLPLDKAVLYTLQVAEAVQEAHTQGVVLRDLQPEHVFLAEKRNGAPVAKLTDFGTCKVVKDPSANGELSCTRLLGLSSSASPELVRQSKTINGRADVWSLGCLFYELLTGQPAFRGEGVQLALAITQDHPTPVSKLRNGLPANLDQVIGWALAKDPERRFSDVYAFAHELRTFACRRGRLLIEEIGRLATGCAVAPIEPANEEHTVLLSITPPQHAAVQKPQPAAQPEQMVVPLPAVRQPAPSLLPAGPSVVVKATHVAKPVAAEGSAQSPLAQPQKAPNQTVAAVATVDTRSSMQPWQLEGVEPVAKPRRKLAWLVALPAAALVALAVSVSASAPAAASVDGGGLHAAATAATAFDLSDYQSPEVAPVAPAAKAKAEPDSDADKPDEEQKKTTKKAPKRSSRRSPRRTASHGGSQFLGSLKSRSKPSRKPSSSNSAARGTLVAMAVGSSCTFSVDGSPRGTSSSIRISVPAGPHTVTCRQSGGSSRSRTLKVAPGKAAVAVFKF